jgi:hypothetical protein
VRIADVPVKIPKWCFRKKNFLGEKLFYLTLIYFLFLMVLFFLVGSDRVGLDRVGYITPGSANTSILGPGTRGIHV